MRAEALAEKAPPQALFVASAFSGAGLIFMVQPLMAKLLLPVLGGSPAVWNASMAFFQAALLAGYCYAHILQRLTSVRSQAIVHLTVLMAGGIFLPLRMNAVFGDPPSDDPTGWLLRVLLLSVGAPFIALSATAPIVQAWHARAFQSRGRDPYALYAASNLGSLLALLAYPVLVEPNTTLADQRLAWSLGYAAFAMLMATLGIAAAGAGAGLGPARSAAAPASPSWRDRVGWILLAALPSSLMLGVTTHLTTDVASAPFLWVVPLALYLLTFILAFEARSAVRPAIALILQAAILPVCAFFLHLQLGIGTQLLLQLSGFFLTALVCHQALVGRRPDPVHLTEFYLWMSFGGVVGGAFNAFLAPVIFSTVAEYPLVLVLAVLARPRATEKPSPVDLAIAAIGLLAILGIAIGAREDWVGFSEWASADYLLLIALAATFIVRKHRLVLMLMVGGLTLAAQSRAGEAAVLHERSFFGVLKQSETQSPELGPVRKLTHGTTVHGAQALGGTARCRPLAYYAPETVIGSAFASVFARKGPANVGVVGLGTGAVATYTRTGDHLTFFEIDPLVIRIATDPSRFTYTTDCAKGRVEHVVGDARLTLARQPAGAFDLLLVDAFSSDAVPAHLLTTEAMRLYLSRLKPDGVLLMHISNRHLDLARPAYAAAQAAGAAAVVKHYKPAPDAAARMALPQVVIQVARAPSQLIPSPGQDVTPVEAGRPWTDDYTNIVGAILARR